MDGQTIWGALLPLWLIGAPLVWSVVQLFSTPKPAIRQEWTAAPDTAVRPSFTTPGIDPVIPVTGRAW
jgi:hypothetical protein